MPKLTETPPVRCSACFGQYPDRRHVDMEASFDGPVVSGGYMGEDGRVEDKIPVSIDELILCEACLRDGGRLIGLGDVSEKQALLDSRERELETALNQLREYGSEVVALKTALGIEKQHGPPPARRGRPPKVTA